MERGHDGRLRRVRRPHRRARRERLVDVDDVGPEGSELGPNASDGPRAWVDRRVRSIERDVDGPPDRTHPRFDRAASDGREHDDVVTELTHVCRQLSDVDLYAARVVPGVRAGERDPHGQPGWNMCQSDGAAAIASSNVRAIKRVSAVTSARRSPVGSIVERFADLDPPAAGRGVRGSDDERRAGR